MTCQWHASPDHLRLMQHKMQSMDRRTRLLFHFHFYTIVEGVVLTFTSANCQLVLVCVDLGPGVGLDS